MKRYALHPACRVRREAFGLLFYDLRGPRLLFAETGDSVTPAALAEGAEAPDARVERLFETLAAKGFVCEQPVC